MPPTSTLHLAAPQSHISGAVLPLLATTELAETRVAALQAGMVAVALVALLGLFLTARLPRDAVETGDVAVDAAPSPSAT